MNPYFMMKDISGKPKPEIKNANFKPEVLSEIKAKDILEETSVEKFVDKYIKAVGDENFSKAIEYLKKFFLDIDLLKKALVEVTIKYVGMNSLAFVEYVFSLVTAKNTMELTGIMCFLLTKKIVFMADKESLYFEYIDDITELVENLSENKKLTVKERDAVYVYELVKGEQSLDDLLKDQDIKNLVNVKLYKALQYADPTYHAFPMQIYSMISSKSITKKDLEEMREEYIELPKATNEDKNLGKILEKGIY